ncbi:GNAT family N-acetyltransferase [Salinicola avicenniae]|uniref:GNAT family N-acetyltransferase n=1 Tax=Salinicola avicenniae TaxID=2916836 RepID=UPI0020731E6B|nr:MULTISPECIES: N-acetyltransferase [unclassified Salinicola]
MTRVLRPGQPADCDALYQLEERCFEGDRFSRRQLAHLLTRANAVTLVAVDDDSRVIGYGTLLFRRNSVTARLYSFCVDPDARGGGLGRALLEALEQAARQRGSQRLALEVRADNRVAMGLYRRTGYVAHRWLDDYYADGCAAWRMDKRLEFVETPPAAANH